MFSNRYVQPWLNWLQHDWLNITIAAGVAVLLFLLLHLLRDRLVHLCRHGGAWPTLFGRALAKTGDIFLIATAARLVIDYAHELNAIHSIIHSLFTIAAVFQAAVWVREIVIGLIEQRTENGPQGEGLSSAIGLIRLLVTIALFAVASVMVLDNLGVNITGLVAGLGVGGIAIGLAAQGIFADLFAALAILFGRPFRVGDVISYDKTTGAVEEIGLKATRIRSLSGEMRIVSNKSLLDKEVQNLSASKHARGTLTVGLACNTPPDKLDRLPELLLELAETAGAKPVRAGFSAFGASTLDYDLIYDVPGGDVVETLAVRSRLATAILRRFAEEGLEMPFPAQAIYTAAPDGQLVMPYAEARSGA